MAAGLEAGGHGGDLVAAAERFGISPAEFYDFSSNINPLGPPAGLLEELKKHLDDDIQNYPTPHARKLRRTLAYSLNIAEERLIVGNGANELIHLFFLWKRPSRVIIPSPSFAEYERAARLVGARVELLSLSLESPTQDLHLPIESLSSKDVLVFCNPNNPTGISYPSEFLNKILEEAKARGVTVFLDESFFLFTGKPLEDSFSYSNYPNLWTVTSLTKLWALPGLRLGYMIGPPQEVNLLTKNGDPWRVNAPAQRAGLFCLSQKDHLSRSLEFIRRERNFLKEELLQLEKLKVYNGEANFLLVRGEQEGFSSAKLCDELASRAFLIRDASNYPGLDERYFRIAIKSRRENEKLIKGLREVLQKI